MASSVMKFLASCAFMMSGLVPLAGMGQVLSDPTRPPLEVSDSEISQAPSVKQRGLQSVMISQSHCAAIIDGKTVVLGASYGIERLVEINERGVVLQGKNGRRTLALFPAVEMKINEAMPPVKQVFKCQQGLHMQEKTPNKTAGQKEKK